MVVIQPPVWTSIWLTFIGTAVFAPIFNAREVQVSVCFGTNRCNLFSLNCSVGEIIQINSLRYGIYGSRNSQCRNANCSDETKSCCKYADGDCLQNFTEYHKNLILSQCSGNSSCGPLQAVSSVFHALPNCPGQSSQYIVIVYICIHGTDTSGNKSSSSGKSEDGISVPAIIGVVIAVIIVIAVVAVALIIYMRRQKKSTKDDTHISNLPKGMTNHVYERPVESDKSSEVVETSNYDVISDESVLNYSMPEKNKKDNTNIPVTVDKFSDVSAEEYDKIEFKMTGANKASNYDRLAALKGKIGDDPYSHVSNRSKSVTTATPTVNDYSLCKPNSKDTLRNDDDYSHADLERDCCKPNSKDTLRNDDDYSHADLERDCCKPNSKDTLRNDDDYSHADLARDCTIKPESDIGEEDSYNHIDFDDTKHTMQNGTAVNGVARSESKTNSTTCTVVKPRDMVNENHLLK